MEGTVLASNRRVEGFFANSFLVEVFFANSLIFLKINESLFLMKSLKIASMFFFEIEFFLKFLIS